MDESPLVIVAQGGKKDERKFLHSNLRVPDWNKGWVKELFRKAAKTVYFDKGTELFEVGGKVMEGIRWVVWALLVEGKGTPVGGTPPQDTPLTEKTPETKISLHETQVFPKEKNSCKKNKKSWQG